MAYIVLDHDDILFFDQNQEEFVLGEDFPPMEPEPEYEGDEPRLYIDEDAPMPNLIIPADLAHLFEDDDDIVVRDVDDEILEGMIEMTEIVEQLYVMNSDEEMEDEEEDDEMN